jgi:hypothetical protein
MSDGVGTGRRGRQSAAKDVAAQGAIDDWYEAPREAKDWKKVVLIAGLGILSWVATYVGMLELIEANIGDLPVTHKVIVAFSVGMLMIMIVWLLDQLFAPLPFLTKVLYAFGYVFLSLISVGFGFGFYWKVLESRSEASRSAEGAVGGVQTALLGASTRLDQLQQTLDSLTTISRQKADNERTTGTSCPASRAGDGPRRKMREDDAARFGFAGDFVKARASTVKGEISALEADLIKITRDDKSIVDAKSGTRNEFMRGLSRKLDATVTGFNAFRTDPQLKQIRSDLAERADKSTFADSKGGTYTCPDAQLSGALKGVVRAIDGLPEIEKPKIATVEGAEATIEAFRRLTATIHGMLTFKMPPSADEQRELQKKAVQSVENPQAAARLAAAMNEPSGLSKRDYVPLAVAVFVDLCLLLVSMGRPMNRLQSLVPKMREAERGPVIQILSRFSEIHRDEKMRENFEVLRHVVFDYAGAYYVAVPLDAPFVETRREQIVDPATRKAKLMTRQIALPAARREELRVEAHLISNLFTSFEKDNVFKRVMWLNTDSARRRLQQQGSKFANAEAFRIYRFSDGAWSEIILGAVMGAARRVEVRRAQGREDADRREPTLDALFDRMRQAEVEAQADRYVPAPKPVFEHRRSYLPTEAPIDPEIAARYGPYAGRAQAEHNADVSDDLARAAAAEEARHANNNSRPWPSHHQREAEQRAPITPLPEFAATEAPNVLPFKQQPGAPRASADEVSPESEAIRMPNIIARGQTALAAKVEPTLADPQAVTVTATERRFTFELPLHDQRISQGLYGISGILRQHAPAASFQPLEPASEITQETATHAFDTPATTIAPSTSYAAPPTGSDRHMALALPAPIREHEHRG